MGVMLNGAVRAVKSNVSGNVLGFVSLLQAIVLVLRLHAIDNEVAPGNEHNTSNLQNTLI